MDSVEWESFQVRRLTRRLREFLEDCDGSSLDLDGDVFLLGTPPLFERFRATVVDVLLLTYELKKARLGCQDKLDLIRNTCLYQSMLPVEVERLGGTQGLRISDLMKLRDVIEELDRVTEARVSSELVESVIAAEKEIVQASARLKFLVERTRFALGFLIGRDLAALSERELREQAVNYVSLRDSLGAKDRLEGMGLLELSPQILGDCRRKLLATSGAPAEPTAAARKSRSKARGKRGETGSQSGPDSALEIKALLVKHHRYDDPNCELSLEPIKLKKLAEQADYAPSTVSDFFKREFRSYQRYENACKDPETLRQCLMLLNGEVKPKHLLKPSERQLASDYE